MRHANHLVPALLVALACGSANAQWKWRDANGRITASDLPPPATVPEQNILARPADSRRAATGAAAATAASAAMAKAPAGKDSTDPELEARRKRAADEKAAQQRQQQDREAAARAENCTRSKGNLAVLIDGKRIVRTNAQGEVESIDDKGRAEEIQRARAMIASECR
ncbi:MAG: DUF4124 domain-containing protein [Burkholderiaceae bacterium]|nr:DUF4124 domain-containing protein [Burkholderiaceae bacterium]